LKIDLSGKNIVVTGGARGLGLACVQTYTQTGARVALVDIGGGTTDVAVYYDDVIRHTAVIPFGGNVITRDIKEGCAILQRQAESLKIQFGSALGDLAQEDKVVTIPGISGRDPKEISFRSLAYIIPGGYRPSHYDHVSTRRYCLFGCVYPFLVSAAVLCKPYTGGSCIKIITKLLHLKSRSGST